MKQELMIRLADFSVYPSGRDEADGEYNGTKFRETVLRPAVEAANSSGQTICVSLDNVLSFGSSFLEESFGGLVRNGIATKQFLQNRLKIDPGKPSYERFKDSILKYINDAKAP